MVQYMKSILEYRTDFFIQIIAAFIVQTCGLLSIWGMFNRIQQINGWGYWEVVLIYATMNFSVGIGEIFFEGPWLINDLYIKGGLDYLLVRPAPVIFQVFASALGLNGLGNAAVAVLIFMQAMYNLNLEVTAIKITLFIVFLLFALPIKGAIILASTCITFWTSAPGNAFPNFIHNIAEYTKYPITIYPYVIQLILSIIVPYAFLGFYPVSILLDKEGYALIALATPIVSIISFLLSTKLFNLGIKRYESVGN